MPDGVVLGNLTSNMLSDDKNEPSDEPEVASVISCK